MSKADAKKQREEYYVWTDKSGRFILDESYSFGDFEYVFQVPIDNNGDQDLVSGLIVLNKYQGEVIGVATSFEYEINEDFYEHMGRKLIGAASEMQQNSNSDEDILNEYFHTYNGGISFIIPNSNSGLLVVVQLYCVAAQIKLHLMDAEVIQDLGTKFIVLSEKAKAINLQ
jgi:hypothetical protein